jgi:hypothetical protein
VQARIALEEALARKSQEAADAAQRAAEAKRTRLAEEGHLRAARRARLGGLPWRRVAVAGAAVAALALAVLHFLPAGKSPTLEEPLKLRLDTRLGSHNL